MVSKARKEFGIGFGMALAAVIAVEAIIFVVMLFRMQGDDQYAGIGVLIVLANIGWTQILFLPPMAIFQSKVRHRPHRAKGMWMVSGLLFLATSLCNAAAMVG